MAEQFEPTRVAVSDKDAKVSPFKQMGAPGFAVFGGYLAEQEKDRDLAGQKKFETYSNLLANVGIVAAGVRYFLDICSKVAWKVEPADESAEAKKAAEHVEAVIHDMTTSWSQVVRRAVMARFWGFGVQEWTAKKRDDGTVGLADVEPRAQRTIEQWDTDSHGNVLGVVQRSPQDGRDIYLPRGKLVYMVDDSVNDSPEGLGLFRHMAKAAKELTRLELLEMWGYEADLRGIPVVRAPLTLLAEMVENDQIKQTEADALRLPLEGFLEEHAKTQMMGIMLDSATYRAGGESQTPSSVRLFDIELLKGEAGPHAEAAATIERKNRELARIIGVEQLLLGADSKGSHALATDKTETFGMTVDSTMRWTSETFTRDLISVIGRLNGWDEAVWPTFKTDAAQYRDVGQITGALKDVAAAGLSPDDPAVNEVRDLIGLSRVPQEQIDRMVEMATALHEAATEPPEEPGDEEPGDEEPGDEELGDEDEGEEE